MNICKKYSMFIEVCISVFLIILAFIFLNINENISKFLFIISFILGGYKQSIRGLKQLFYEHKFNIEFLMILAAVCATLIGYWEEAAILIAIFSASGALEEYSSNKSNSEIRKLLDLQPKKVRKVLENGKVEITDINDVKIGDILLVVNGDRIPMDGVISEGFSKFNESAITGESLSKLKHEGEEVYSGTLNIWKPIKIKVTKNLSETVIAQIVKMVEAAEKNPMKIKSFIDQAEDIYVKLVLLTVIFVAVFFPLFYKWDWNRAIYTSILLLVVASPCALVASATPSSLAAISNAAKKGVLIKGTKYLELLSKLKVLCIDKTGTLTKGTLKFTNLFLLDNEYQQEILKSLISIEQYSSHPLAKTITSSNKLKEMLLKNYNCFSKEQVEDFLETPGLGVEGKINGIHWKFGNKSHVSSNEIPQIIQEKVLQIEDEIIIYIKRNNKNIGFISFSDKLRESVKKTICFLNKNNIETILLTGDNENIAKKIANLAGIKKYYANLLPQEKLKHIERIKNKYGITAMIGDGINDSPSLAKADLGIAMGKGSDLAIESSDIILIDNKIENLYYLFRLSKKLNKIIIENLLFSATIVVVLVICSFTNSISLPLGVIGHEGSTILVILNGLRLLKFD